MVALRVGPLGSEGGVEGSFLSSVTLFLVFLRQLCRRCWQPPVQRYHCFAHGPRGLVCCWCCWQRWLGHVFLQVLRLLLSHNLLALETPSFAFFVSVLTLVSAPPTSSPPLLTLVFPAAVSSVPGRAARRYSPTKTHMHFQTDEEEEEKEEAVKKRVCEPGRTV